MDLDAGAPDPARRAPWQSPCRSTQGRSAINKNAARALRSAVRGRVFFPRTPGYNSRRLVYNTRFDGIRPDAVVQAESTADVAAVVRWAGRFGVPIVARSGGHSYAGYSTLSNGVVVDLSKLGGVKVSNGRARVGAGVQLIDLQRSLTRRGLSVPSGSCPSVGVAGLTLGGGHGLAGRRFGLTCDNLRAATIVPPTPGAPVDQPNEDLTGPAAAAGGTSESSPRSTLQRIGLRLVQVSRLLALARLARRFCWQLSAARPPHSLDLQPRHHRRLGSPR